MQKNVFVPISAVHRSAFCQSSLAVINPSEKNWQIAPLCSVSEELKTVSITVPPLRHAYVEANLRNWLVCKLTG